MTAIAPSQADPNFAAAANQAFEGAQFVLAAGVLGSFFGPLGAGALAFGKFPSLFNVTAGTLCHGHHDCPPTVEPKATWTAQMTGQNTANIDLGDGYQLNIDERSSQMNIINTATGQTTRIWGDPHVDVDGQHKFDFFGTTTFQLANGTKITIKTEPWQGNSNAYVASQVVITKGQNAIVVDGISQNKLGDLSVSMSNDGYAIDAATRDGFTVRESLDTHGWTTENGHQVTQADADATRPGGLYGPGSEALSLGEVGQLLGSFLLFGAFASGLGGDSSTGSAISRIGHHHHHPHHALQFA